MVNDHWKNIVSAGIVSMTDTNSTRLRVSKAPAHINRGIATGLLSHDMLIVCGGYVVFLVFTTIFVYQKLYLYFLCN